MAGLRAQVEVLREGLERIQREADEFYIKWHPRLGQNPILGYAAEVDLLSTSILAAAKAKELGDG